MACSHAFWLFGPHAPSTAMLYPRFLSSRCTGFASLPSGAVEGYQPLPDEPEEAANA